MSILISLSVSLAQATSSHFSPDLFTGRAGRKRRRSGSYALPARFKVTAAFSCHGFPLVRVVFAGLPLLAASHPITCRFSVACYGQDQDTEMGFIVPG